MMTWGDGGFNKRNKLQILLVNEWKHQFMNMMSRIARCRKNRHAIYDMIKSVQEKDTDQKRWIEKLFTSIKEGLTRVTRLGYDKHLKEKH